MSQVCLEHGLHLIRERFKGKGPISIGAQGSFDTLNELGASWNSYRFIEVTDTLSARGTLDRRPYVLPRHVLNPLRRCVSIFSVCFADPCPQIGTLRH